MKLGMQGITVVTASGDDGVASNSICGRGEVKSIPCNDGCIGEQQLIFNPDFPSSCPWILSVGGTAPSRNSETGEKAWSGSGGGFSNVFPIPKYQQAAVEAYFKSPAAPKYPYCTMGDFDGLIPSSPLTSMREQIRIPVSEMASTIELAEEVNSYPMTFL